MPAQPGSSTGSPRAKASALSTSTRSAARSFSFLRRNRAHGSARADAAGLCPAVQRRPRAVGHHLAFALGIGGCAGAARTALRAARLRRRAHPLSGTPRARRRHAGLSLLSHGGGRAGLVPGPLPARAARRVRASVHAFGDPHRLHGDRAADSHGVYRGGSAGRRLAHRRDGALPGGASAARDGNHAVGGALRGDGGIRQCLRARGVGSRLRAARRRQYRRPHAQHPYRDRARDLQGRVRVRHCARLRADGHRRRRQRRARLAAGRRRPGVSPLFKAEGIVKRFGERVLFDAASLELETGNGYVLIGPNGSGKTTLLRVLAGLDFAQEGKLVYRAREAAAAGPYPEPWRREIVYAHQQPYLFRTSLADNVEYGLARSGMARERPAALAAEALAWAGLTARHGVPPHRLSGGEKQRAALARAKVLDPALLLLDEPTAHLHGEARAPVLELARPPITERHTVLIAPHDPEIIRLAILTRLRVSAQRIEVAE